ncbi:sensor histidine kinase [Litoribacterium kuwaitense]|uniref:sensor histidine kinase n=1 Tax=Litoribacterium kuwaitense TaxID=1398745 RepID=UPI001FEC063E|nr:HAMP domain-containing sensor histidine kinase [Litoribacterium kuwaitense]
MKPAHDEIHDLTEHFNAMALRIHEQVNQIHDQETKRKALVSNLSHDLKTPLTNILGYAETINQGMYKDEAELHAYTQLIFRQSQYMERLMNTLFNISNLDSLGMNVTKKPTNIVGLLRRTLADYIPMLDHKGIKTSISIPDQVVIAEVDGQLIDRAIRNVIDNAMLHGASGKYLGIQLCEQKGQVIMAITDRGSGILEEQQKLIFERFFQGSQERKNEGFGIGLSLVQEIVEAHHGTIHVKSERNVETTFVIVLPRTDHGDQAKAPKSDRK